MLSDREKIIRRTLRVEKRERWRLVEIGIQSGNLGHWQFWQEHTPIDKFDMRYMFGRDSKHLRRHILIELHYLKQSSERQFELEQMFAGVKS